MRINLRVLPLIAVAALMIGCGKKEKAPDADSMAAANAPAPIAPAPVSVKNLDLGKSLNADKSINDNTGNFGPRDTMYLSVQTDGVGDATIGVRWATEAGTLVDSSSQTLASNGEARTEFHVMKKSAWPVGNYQVDVTLNGVAAGTKKYEVKRP